MKTIRRFSIGLGIGTISAMCIITLLRPYMWTDIEAIFASLFFAIIFGISNGIYLILYK